MPLAATDPVPLPARLTVSVAYRVNVASTDRSMSIATVHVAAEPLHAPPHAARKEPAVGVAVNVTTVPALNECEQD